MNIQQAVREQLNFWHGTLDGMVGECDTDVLHKAVPGSTTNAIAVTYAHAVCVEDFLVHSLQGKPALSQAAGWAAKTGVPLPSTPPAMWQEWATGLNLNLAPFLEYAKSVYAATDAYVAGLSDADLDKKTQGPFGETTVGYMVAIILATHIPQHAGEVAALKGVHGMKGLPF
jgi:hypothetical protein